MRSSLFKIEISTPWFHGWNVVGATIVCQALIVGAVLYSFTFFVVPLSEAFSVGKGQVMLAMTFLSLASAVVSPFVGRVVDRQPVRRLMIVGVLSTFSGFVLASLAQSLWLFYLSFAILMPIGMVCAGTLSAQALVSRWFNHRRGFALGLSAMGTSLGGVAFPLFIAGLLENYDWRTIYLYLGVGILLIALPTILLFVREPTLQETESNTVPNDRLPSSSGSPIHTDIPIQKFWSTAEIIKSRDFWLLAVWLFPLLLAALSIQLNLVPIGQELGIGSGSIAIVASFFAIAAAVGKVLWGILGDLIEARFALWLAAAAICFPLSVLMHASYMPLFLCLMFLIGLGMGAFGPLLAAVVANRFGPSAVGGVMGLLAPIFFLSSLGPPVAGMMSDATGSYLLASIVGAIIILPVFGAIYFLSPNHRKSLPGEKALLNP